MTESQKTIEDVLATHGFFMTTTAGVSMEPLFRHRRDEVIIRPVHGRLKRLDVPLYRRGDRIILHRIVKVTPDGYIICGDNCETLEKDITDSEIIGVLSAFYRKGKYHTVDELGYRIYAQVHVALFPVRRMIKKAKRFLRRSLRKLIRKGTD